jgi:hypothetical protein
MDGHMAPQQGMQTNLEAVAALHGAATEVVCLLYTNGRESDGYRALTTFADQYAELLDAYPIPLLAEQLEPLLAALQREDIVALCDILLLDVQPLLELLHRELSGGSHE